MSVNHLTNVPAVPHDDDFEFCPLVHEQIIHGDIFSCIDGNWNDGEGKSPTFTRCCLQLP